MSAEEAHFVAAVLARIKLAAVAQMQSRTTSCPVGEAVTFSNLGSSPLKLPQRTSSQLCRRHSCTSLSVRLGAQRRISCVEVRPQISTVQAVWRTFSRTQCLQRCRPLLNLDLRFG